MALRRHDWRVKIALANAGGIATLLLLGACASAPPAHRAAPPQPLAPIVWPDDSPATQIRLLNRVTWGANRSSFEEIRTAGAGRFLDRQLRPQGDAKLPPDVQARIDGLTISQRSMSELAADMAQKREAFRRLLPEERKPAQQAYQQALTRLGQEAQTRM